MWCSSHRRNLLPSSCRSWGHVVWGCGREAGQEVRKPSPECAGRDTSPGPLALVLFSKLLLRLPAHHPENPVEAPSVSPGPPCQPPPSSAFPVPELSEVMAAEGLCVGCSSTQTPVLCSEDSLLQPSRAFSAGPAPLHLSSDIYLPDPQSEEAPSQRSETWADLEF